MVGDQGLAALRGGGACDRGTRPCPRLSPAPCTRSPSPPPRGDTEAARAGAREPTPRHGHPVLAAWRSALQTPVRGLHRSPGPAARASPSRPVSPLRPRHQFPFLQQLQGVCHLHVREGDRTAARPPLGLVSRVRWFQTAQAARPSLECGNLGGRACSKTGGQTGARQGRRRGGPRPSRSPVNGKHRPRARVASRKHPSADRQAGAAGTQEPPEGLRAEGALTRETRPSPRRSFRSPPGTTEAGKAAGPPKPGL